jgi:hypothetical protein
MSAKPPEPTELIYLPTGSWAPVLVAAGVTLVAVGVFNGWVFSAIGALILLAGMRSWWKRSDDEISSMRREQRTETAVIPAEPIRRR